MEEFLNTLEGFLEKGVVQFPFSQGNKNCLLQTLSARITTGVAESSVFLVDMNGVIVDPIDGMLMLLQWPSTATDEEIFKCHQNLCYQFLEGIAQIGLRDYGLGEIRGNGDCGSDL